MLCWVYFYVSYCAGEFTAAAVLNITFTPYVNNNKNNNKNKNNDTDNPVEAGCGSLEFGRNAPFSMQYEDGLQTDYKMNYIHLELG